jgi:hypothetical protein
MSTFNETARQTLRETKSLCYLLLDAKPVTLVPQDVEFVADDARAPGTIFLRFQLASDLAIASDPHRLVIESNFCPFDGELLPLPKDATPLVYHRHGRLVRILKVAVAGEPGTKFSFASTGQISQREGQEVVQCFLNNITTRLQVDFSLPGIRSNTTVSPGADQAAAEEPRVDAVTGPTPIALRAPVRVTEISTLDAVSFAPTEKDFGEISYTLSRPAWIRIRIVSRNDSRMVFRTLVDWSRREAGRNTEKWDGRDSAGHLIDKTATPCRVVIDAESDVHRRHPRTLCKDLGLSLTLNDASSRSAPEKTDLVVTVDENTRGYGEWLGYRVTAYIDFKPVHSAVYRQKAWQGIRIPLDTAGLAEGDHLLIVVVEDGADHVGCTSLTFHSP